MKVRSVLVHIQESNHKPEHCIFYLVGVVRREVPCRQEINASSKLNIMDGYNLSEARTHRHM